VRPKQPIFSPVASFGSHSLLLLLAAEGVDRIHDQRALHRREGADARVAALELLHDEPVGDVVQPGAAVLLGQVGPEHAQLADLGDELRREAPLDVGVADDGMTRSSTHSRTVSRIIRSSSERSESMS
jgi:hypothetical protein